MKTDSNFAPDLTPDEYARGFAIFRKNTNQRQMMLEWFGQQMDLLTKNSSCRVLSIGCGNGDFDLALIEKLQSNAQQLNYVAIDPNPVMLQAFQKQMHLVRSPQVKIQLLNCSFEQLDLTRLAHFDLIHFTHCLYFIEDRLSAILKALKALSRSGSVIILNSMTAGIQDVRIRFTQRALGKTFATFTGEQLRNILFTGKVSHRFEVLECVTEITECFDHDSAIGNLLLSFFLECDSERVSFNLKAEILDHLRSISYQDGDKIVMPHPIAAAIVRR